MPRIFGLGCQSENLRLPEHSRLSKPADAAIGRRTPAFGGFPPALLGPIRRLRSPAGSDNGSGWILAEEAGVEPTEDAWRPPTDLKSARITGPDALPTIDFIECLTHCQGPLLFGFAKNRPRGCSLLLGSANSRGRFCKTLSAPVPITPPPHSRRVGDL